MSTLISIYMSIHISIRMYMRMHIRMYMFGWQVPDVAPTAFEIGLHWHIPTAVGDVVDNLVLDVAKAVNMSRWPGLPFPSL